MVDGSNRLKCLADETGGKFYNINNAAQFGTAMGVSFETLPENAFDDLRGNFDTQNQNSGDGYHYEYIKQEDYE